MERRQYPRLDIPLVIEISHAALGQRTCTARDLSDGGLFIHLKEHGLQVGARVKVKRSITELDNLQHTPQVDAAVVRIEADGLGLAFNSSTAAHLWRSVERSRETLHIGRDLFQVFQLILVEHAERGVLLVQQHGRWQLPGFYLDAQQPMAAQDYCLVHLNLMVQIDEQPLAWQTAMHPLVPEAAAVSLVLLAHAQQSGDGRPLEPSLPEGSQYKDWRWIHRVNDLNDATLNDQWVRVLLEQRLTEREQAT